MAIPLLLSIAACSGESAPEVVATAPSSSEVATTPAPTTPEPERRPIPDVVGQSPEAAGQALAADGFAWTTIGSGSLVQSQTPSAGIAAIDGATVTLTLADPTPDGTRARPFVAGSTLTATVGGGEVTLDIGSANWDAATIVANENMFNDPAPDGSTYVLLPVTITNVSATEAVVPWIAWDISYVAPDGRSFDEASGVIPGDLMDVGDLYEGGVGSGNVLFAIPADALGGLWVVSYGYSSEAVFIQAT